MKDAGYGLLGMRIHSNPASPTLAGPVSLPRRQQHHGVSRMNSRMIRDSSSGRSSVGAPQAVGLGGMFWLSRKRFVGS